MRATQANVQARNIFIKHIHLLAKLNLGSSRDDSSHLIQFFKKVFSRHHPQRKGPQENSFEDLKIFGRLTLTYSIE